VESLRKSLRVSAEEAKGIADEAGSYRVFLRRLGSSGIVATEAVLGTAHCQRFNFFDISGKGPAKPLMPPEPADESAYCRGDSHGTYATMGTIGRTPSFAVETFGKSGEDIRVIARRAGEWVQSCRLQVSWQPLFEQAEEFCDSVACSQFAKTAIALAAALDTSSDFAGYWKNLPEAAVPDVVRDRFKDYAEQLWQYLPAAAGGFELTQHLIDSAQYRAFKDGERIVTIVRAEDNQTRSVVIVTGAEGQNPHLLFAPKLTAEDPLPTFGRIADSSHVAFDGDSALVPLQIGGTILIARVGHGWFGWRQSENYLIAIYSIDSDVPNPVAGFVVNKLRAPHPRVEIN
jgi:hypothetical protein